MRNPKGIVSPKVNDLNVPSGIVDPKKSLGIVNPNVPSGIVNPKVSSGIIQNIKGVKHQVGFIP